MSSSFLKGKKILATTERLKRKEREHLVKIAPMFQVAFLGSVPEEKKAIWDRLEIFYGSTEIFRQREVPPHLKWAHFISTGVDDLVASPLWRSSVILTTSRGASAVSMAEYAMAMILAFRWRLLKMVQFREQRTWTELSYKEFEVPELQGQTLGIIGYGAAGRALAHRAHAMGMRILAVNRSGKRLFLEIGDDDVERGDVRALLPERIYSLKELPAMLPHCDFIVLLAPLTAATQSLVNDKFFSVMKRGAYLINLSRGALVDERALVKALQEKRLQGAALDVFEEEPLPPASPLWGLDNVILSPHVSGWFTDYPARAWKIFVENLRRYVEGQKMLNIVSRKRGY